jgi:phytol kinase
MFIVTTMQYLTLEAIQSIKASRSLQNEVLRKMLHFLIALVPPLAAWNLPFTVLLLSSGTIFYAAAEVARVSGTSVFVIGEVTSIVARPRDRGKLIMGPVTLALGAMLALLLYPEPSASIAVYALAFGDGLASLVGMTLRGPRLPFTRGKTVSGSLACFLAVTLIAGSLGFHGVSAAAIGFAAAFLESLPTGDFDNILIPIGVGALATTLLPVLL